MYTVALFLGRLDFLVFQPFEHTLLYALVLKGKPPFSLARIVEQRIFEAAEGSFALYRAP